MRKDCDNDSSNDVEVRFDGVSVNLNNYQRNYQKDEEQIHVSHIRVVIGLTGTSFHSNQYNEEKSKVTEE